MESYSIQNLTFCYPGRAQPALSCISLVIEQGSFVTLCGPSGGGKTTLLRQLKPILSPHGEKSGEILFYGQPIEQLEQRTQSEKIGFVLQNVENQIVTDKVWHELAFGLESLGYPTSEIRLRVAEMAAFFGIDAWFYKNVTELSGGQKQLLNLASIMAMQPSVLILDEPTSQLDPIAAADFLATVGKINRELGVTVIMTEHRLEEVFPLSDVVVCLDSGKIVCDGSPHRVGEVLRGLGHGMFLAMPTPMRIWAGVPTGSSEFGVRNSEITEGSEHKNNAPRSHTDKTVNTAGQISDTSSAFGIPSSEFGICPITVRDGRTWLDKLIESGAAELDESAILTPASPEPASHDLKTPVPAIELNEVWFRYEKETPDVIRRLSLKVNNGEFLCIVGGNGAGKTTALMLMAGLHRPQRGKIKLFGKNVFEIPPAQLFSDGGDGGMIGILPQNPQAVFVKKTVREDLLEIFLGRKVSKEDKEQRLKHVSRLCRIESVLDAHPYDLSGGEQQRAALAKILLLRPRILLLDEPTKGLDAEFKLVFASILKNLTESGVAVVLVSHDIEFCAEHGDRCAMFFDGSVVTDAPPREFFSGNSFYTTAANRMARHKLPRAITADDVLRALGARNQESGGSKPEPEDNSDSGTRGSDANDNAAHSPVTTDHPVSQSAYEARLSTHEEQVNAFPQDDMADIISENDPKLRTPNSERRSRRRKTLPLWRKIIAAISALLLIGSIILIILNFTGFISFISGGSEAEQAMRDPRFWRYAAMLISLCAAALILAVMLNPSDKTKYIPRVDKRKLSKRTLVATAMVLLAIPLTIFVGIRFLDDRRYYFISMLIILETMLPFVLVFEGRKPQAREIVVIAVLCALGVAGRTAFFMLPHIKPVAALAIITGVAFGGEAGFLFGAMTGFLSNMFFGQGAWTPWQMFAYGIIGFLAGVMFRKGLLARSRTALCVYGGLAVLAIYGGLMNSSSVLMYQSHPSPGMFLAYFVQGIPLDLIHAASTIMFLGILAHPMLEKLDRIKAKYGLLS